MFALSVFSVTANKAKVFFGLLKEPELNIPLEDDEEGEGEGDATGKPKVSLQRRPRGAHSHIQKPELGERKGADHSTVNQRGVDRFSVNQKQFLASWQLCISEANSSPRHPPATCSVNVHLFAKLEGRAYGESGLVFWSLTFSQIAPPTKISSVNDTVCAQTHISNCSYPRRSTVSKKQHRHVLV